MEVMIDESCKYLVQMFQSFLRRYFLHITVVFHPIRNYNDIRLDNHFIVLSVHFPAVSIQIIQGGRRGHDHMVVGFTTTCAISAYHH